MSDDDALPAWSTDKSFYSKAGVVVPDKAPYLVKSSVVQGIIPKTFLAEWTNAHPGFIFKDPESLREVMAELERLYPDAFNVKGE